MSEGIEAQWQKIQASQQKPESKREKVVPFSGEPQAVSKPAKETTQEETTSKRSGALLPENAEELGEVAQGLEVELIQNLRQGRPLPLLLRSAIEIVKVRAEAAGEADIIKELDKALSEIFSIDEQEEAELMGKVFDREAQVIEKIDNIHNRYIKKASYELAMMTEYHRQWASSVDEIGDAVARMRGYIVPQGYAKNKD